MKNSIKIVIAYEEIPFKLKNLKNFIKTVLDKISVMNWSMGLLITNDEEIRNYNRIWRQIDVPTDVLTFVQSDGESVPQPPEQPLEAGDIVISLEQIIEQSIAAQRPLEEEMRRIIIHGILHLKGMIHPEDDYDNCGMLILQESLIAETRALAVKT